jgi:hypothetical protein
VSWQNVVFIALGVMGLACLLAVPHLLAEFAPLVVIAAYTLAVGNPR